MIDGKREIIILDCEQIKCPQVLIFVFVELCQAFIDRNYTVKIIKIFLEKGMRQSAAKLLKVLLAYEEGSETRR